MKKDTKNILMIAGLGVAGFVGYNWWKKRQQLAAEETGYMPPGYGGGGVRISIPLWGGEDVCGPCNEGTPEEGDVTPPTEPTSGESTLEFGRPGYVERPLVGEVIKPTTPTEPEPSPEKGGVTPIATKEPSPYLTRYPRGELDVLEEFLRNWPIKSVTPFGTVSPPPPSETVRTPITVTGWTGRYGIRPLHLLPREGGGVPKRPTPITVTQMGGGPGWRGPRILPREGGGVPERPTTPTPTTVTGWTGRYGIRPLHLLPREGGGVPERTEKEVVSALAQNRIKRSTGVAGVAASGGSRRWIR